jgi:hypothetical protein
LDKEEEIISASKVVVGWLPSLAARGKYDLTVKNELFMLSQPLKEATI